MNGFNWSRFSVRINIRSQPDTLYRAWVTKPGLEHWFLRDTIFISKDGRIREKDEPIEAGDSYTWYWHGWPDETREVGEILSTNHTDALSFRFGKAGICTVRIYSYQDEQVVELVQHDIPTGDEEKVNWHLGCKTGWTFYLANLKSLLEGGIDLRNKDLGMGETLNK
jgi:uncharacterized protein YndB with AHSA1/START domain